MAIPFEAHIDDQDLKGNNQVTTDQISVAQLDHLPIVACYLRNLRLVEIVNQLVPIEMNVELGIIFLGLVLDTLSGRSPLYHLETAFEGYDSELLFGQNIPAGYFSNDNVGRVMDHVYNVGTQKIFSALSILVWRLMEHTMRSELKHNNATIPGWDNKETKRPTSYMLTWKFKGVMSLCIGGTRQLGKPLSQVQRRFLERLKIPINCFTDISL